MKKYTLIILSILLLASTVNADNNNIKHCKQKWNANYRMIEHCLNRQKVAEIAVAYWAESDQYDDDIWDHCAEKWTDANYVSNYRMMDHCIKKQTAAKARLENNNVE